MTIPLKCNNNKPLEIENYPNYYKFITSRKEGNARNKLQRYEVEWEVRGNSKVSRISGRKQSMLKLPNNLAIFSGKKSTALMLSNQVQPTLFCLQMCLLNTILCLETLLNKSEIFDRQQHCMQLVNVMFLIWYCNTKLYEPRQFKDS